MGVFFSADDRQEYLDLLSQSASKHALDFLASCLISHHAHFVGGVPSGENARAHVQSSALRFSVKVGRKSVAGALPFLFDGRTERFGVTQDERVALGSGFLV
jgi:hypothetical protein